NGQNTSFSADWTEPNSLGTRYIWMLSSHTHKYGVDYDIFERNSDGTKGTQLYEGFYNSDYTFNQGFYDWEHPAVRYFEPLIENKKSDGLIHEAVYNNTGNVGVTWGLTTQDEMMLIYVQFTDIMPEPAGISSNIQDKDLNVYLYPNPNSGSFNLNIPEEYQDTPLDLEIYSIDGQRVHAFSLNGNTDNRFVQLTNLSQGTYILKVASEEHSVIQKFNVQY
ncbi:MAG: T9SS type A sorting domain-containing protein, partial [Flavobacteriales bacterium]|nr:T9SS type A sorting domain-containing protein [Flavobacteriales bacterium]